MRVVVIIFEQLVPISGGGSPRIWHTVRAFVRGGHQVYVAASYGIPPEAARQELGCADVFLLTHVSRLDRHKMLKYSFVYPWNILRCAFYIWRIKPDIILAHNSVAGLAALLGKNFHPSTLTVLDLTDLLFEYLESYQARWTSALLLLGRALEKHTIRNSNRIITISNSMRNILVQRYGVSNSKVDIVHDGVDCSVFYPQDAKALRRRVSPWAQHVCILHGVIDPQDAPQLLVEAAPRVLSRFPKTAFWWIGDGAAVPALKTRAAQLKLNDKFFFSGWVGQQEVVNYINASDLGLVVLPDILSARGRVTLKEFEYWACGKAAVLPRLPALQEIIPEGEASLFYTPGDADDLAEKICALLADDERRRAMGQRGRQIVAERFEWRVLTEEVARLCESYVGQQVTTRNADSVRGCI